MLTPGSTSPCDRSLRLFAKTGESQHTGIAQQLSDQALRAKVKRHNYNVGKNRDKIGTSINFFFAIAITQTTVYLTKSVGRIIMKSYALLLTAALTVMSAAHAQTANLTQALPQAELYRINAGDDLEVFVWGEDRLQRTVKVLPDGSFSFPLVGRVDAMGRLPTEIEAQISKGLQSQFRNQVPQVTVSVKNPAGLQFSIVGKVKNPGNFSPARYVNVLEAIGIAGGASEFADVSNVVILRKTASGLTPIHVRLSDALRGNPNSRDLAANGLPNLVSGDTVIVP